jgi:hypothetical protein
MASWAFVAAVLAPALLLAAGQAPTPAPAIIRFDESGALQLVDGNVSVALKDVVLRSDPELSLLTATVSSLTATVSALRAEAAATTATPTTTTTTTRTLSNVTTLRTLDSAGDVGGYTSLQISTAGNPVVSYRDIRNLDLKLAVCSDPTCAANATLRTLDSAGNVGTSTSLQISVTGNPVVSYYGNFSLKLAVCSDPTCATVPTLRTLDSAGVVGLSTSLQISAAGNPVVSYYDRTNANLKLAVCSDPTCAAAPTLRVLDSSAGNVGSYTSLQISAAGNPIVSYYDDTNGDLKLAVCSDPTCAAAPTLRVLDSAGDVGYSTSLQISAAGNPVVSYFSYVDRSLKLAVVS